MDDEHRQVAAMLVRRADSAGEFVPPSMDDLHRRVAPRRSARLISAVVGAAALVAAVVVGLVTVSERSSHTLPVGVPTSVTTSHATDAQTISRLWLAATRFAKMDNGTVLKAEAVKSILAKAVQVTTGDGVQGDQPVWVIQVEGVRPFLCDACLIAPGAKTPTGRYLLLVLDATTFQISDFSIGAKNADLARLGPVIALHG